MGLKSNEAIDHVNTSIFEFASPAHIRLLIKTSTNFNNGKDPVITFTDPKPFLDGQFGLAVVDGAAIFQNVYINGVPATTSPKK